MSHKLLLLQKSFRFEGLMSSVKDEGDGLNWKQQPNVFPVNFK